MDCTSKYLIMKSNTSVFLSLLSQGVLNTLQKGITTFVDYLTCPLLLRLFYHYSITVLLLWNCSSITEKCTTWPKCLLASNQASVSVVCFVSWQKHLFIIALFRAFESLFLGNAGHIMWGYVLYLQSKHCKNEKLYLWWLLMVNLGNIIQSCWVNRRDLVLYFHWRTPHVMVHCTHTYVMQM